MNPIIYIVAAGIIVAIALLVGFNVTKNKSKEIVKTAQEEAKKITQDADKTQNQRKKKPF